MCQDYEDCNSRGFCISGACRCDAAWFGEKCYENLEDFFPDTFVAYKIIFLIIYSLIGLISFIRLYNKVKNERRIFAIASTLLVLKTMRSPYNLAMLFVFAIALTRILWMAIDPFGYEDIFHRSVERVFFETTYSFLFMIYAIVLWAWCAIHEQLSSKNLKKSKTGLKWVQSKLKIMVIIIIIVQIATSILKGFYNNEIRWFTYAIYCGLFFILFLLVIEYVIYGWLLYQCIINKEKAVKKQLEKLAGQTGCAVEAFHKPKKGEYHEELEKQGSLKYCEVPKTPTFDNIRINGTEKFDITENIAESTPNPDETQGINIPESSTKRRLVAFKQVPQQEGESSMEPPSPIKLGRKHESSPYPKHYSKGSMRDIMSPTEIGSQKVMSEITLTNLANTAFDKKVTEIVEKHTPYLQPMTLIDPEEEELDTDNAVILDTSTELQWNIVDDIELRKQDEKRKRAKRNKAETKLLIAKLRRNPLVRSYSESEQKFSLTYAFQMKLFNDITYLENCQEIAKKDKIVVKKIFSLTVIAICLEVLFLIVTLIVLVTPVIQNPTLKGMMVSMWFTGFMEVFAVVSIICLFSLVESQQNENLRLIMTIGQNKNKINKLYRFALPTFLRTQQSKKNLEKNINHLAIRYLRSGTITVT